MKRCKYCGKINPDENTNCETCGSPLPVERERSIKRCKYCGKISPDENTHCEFCGSPLPDTEDNRAANAVGSMPLGAYGRPNVGNGERPGQNGGYNRNDPYPNGFGEGSYVQPRRPAVYPSGGLIGWSIVTLLLCTIPGIVALVYASGINSCSTVIEQEKKIDAAKTWCTVGTILGILALIVVLAK